MTACPVPGCLTTGGAQWMTDRHAGEPHCRCLCGWVGLTGNHRRHIGQRRRVAREAGLPAGPTSTHVIAYPINPNHHLQPATAGPCCKPACDDTCPAGPCPEGPS